MSSPVPRRQPWQAEQSGKIVVEQIADPRYRQVGRRIADVGGVAGHGARGTPLDQRRTRGTQHSVRVVLHSVDNDVDFGALVLDVENILAHAIVTGVCGVGAQRCVFGLAPGDRKWR